MQRSLNNISEGGDRTKQSAQKSIQFNNDSEGKDEKSEDGQSEKEECPEEFTEAPETKEERPIDEEVEGGAHSDEESF